MVMARRRPVLGFYLRSLLLGGDPRVSEGLYTFDRWAVRLGCDPRSADAKMASLHESYKKCPPDAESHHVELFLQYLLPAVVIGFRNHAVHGIWPHGRAEVTSTHE